jgi:hypothetical protein
MFKTTHSLLYIAFAWLTAYMGRAGLILYAGDIDLNAPEVKDAIKAAVEEAVSGLSTKNAELLKEVKELRKGKSVNPEDLDRIESERDDLKAQLNQAQKDLKAANANAEKATKALADEQGFTTKLLADNGLADALVKAGVNNPAHLKAVKALLGSQVQIVNEGDQRVAKVGDIPLADFVDGWAKSDDGKHFVSAPVNSGGGGNGGSNGSNSKTMTRAQFDASSQVERSTFSKEGGKVVD